MRKMLFNLTAAHLIASPAICVAHADKGNTVGWQLMTAEERTEHRRVGPTGRIER